MTHMRYWAMSLAAAVCGGFVAIERFAFAPGTAVWIAFGVAIAATVFSLAGLVVALVRENQAFSGLSALGALAGAWTIIAMRTFSTHTALWLAFTGGLIVLIVALLALALHETTIERVVHALELSEAPEPGTTTGSGAAASRQAQTVRARRLPLGPEMRSWMHWLTQTALALAGAFVVVMTYALSGPGHHAASPRWITFGIGIAATSLALTSLLERALARDGVGHREGGIGGRAAAMLLTAASAAVAIAMIVTMITLHGSGARWVAFALGCGLVGVSLLAAVIHELTSERVRHELEIARPAVGARLADTPAAPAG